MVRHVRTVVVVLAVATALGALVLWPRGPAPDLRGTTADLPYVEATVTGVELVPCSDPEEGLPTDCWAVDVDLDSGPEAGSRATFLSSTIDFSAPRFEPGDRVVLAYNDLAPEDFRYWFVEFQRDAPLLVLGIAFVVVVVVFGRWKGVRALAGLAATLLVILGFLLPAMLRDEHAVAVALVATSLIAFVALYVTHGVRRATTVALLGTLASVALITLLAAVTVAATRLTGLSSEDLQLLRVTAEAVDPRGILLAGMVIGALGVLDDVTVTQVSAVAELRRANPDLGRRQIYAAAVRIGRDHVAATVNTLVLAYAGSSLALLLFFLQEGRSVGQVLTGEVVAIEIVRTLVGSIGLIASVPVTTALAVVLEVDDAGEHHHAHGPPPRPPAWDDFAPPAE